MASHLAVHVCKKQPNEETTTMTHLNNLIIQEFQPGILERITVQHRRWCMSL